MVIEEPEAITGACLSQRTLRLCVESSFAQHVAKLNIQNRPAKVTLSAPIVQDTRELLFLEAVHLPRTIPMIMFVAYHDISSSHSIARTHTKIIIYIIHEYIMNYARPPTTTDWYCLHHVHCAQAEEVLVILALHHVRLRNSYGGCKYSCEEASLSIGPLMACFFCFFCFFFLFAMRFAGSPLTEWMSCSCY